MTLPYECLQMLEFFFKHCQGKNEWLLKSQLIKKYDEKYFWLVTIRAVAQVGMIRAVAPLGMIRAAAPLDMIWAAAPLGMIWVAVPLGMIWAAAPLSQIWTAARIATGQNYTGKEQLTKIN